jgi:DNA polymerase alpha subunit A
MIQTIKTEEDDEFLAGLLGEVDRNVPAVAPRQSRKRERSPEKRRTRIPSPAPDVKRPAVKRARRSPEPAVSAPQDDDTLMGDDDDSLPIMDDHLPAPILANDTQTSDPAPSSPTVDAVGRKTKTTTEVEADDEEDEDMMEVAHAGAINATSVNLTAARVPKKLIKPDPYPSPASSSPPKGPSETTVDSSAWNDINQRLNVVSSSPSESRGINKIDYKDAIEEDGSLNMFWTDYTEVNGSLCLFGKTLNKKTRSYVSCFVKVDNILRKLFFLPRQNRVERGVETDEEVGMMDVYKEIDALMSKMHVDMFKIKACTRKYAFELPGIPKETQYMKLLYPYTSESSAKQHSSGCTDASQSPRWKWEPLARHTPKFSVPTLLCLSSLSCGKT